MVKLKHNPVLFNASGCLTLDAINRYHSGTLSNKELEEVRQHMEECEMCRDAVEGYKHLTDLKRQHELVYTLQKTIRGRYLTRPQKMHYNRDRRIHPKMIYISAAATILIILGIFGLLNTDIFHHNDYVAEQIQEEKMESEDRITRIEDPITDAQPVTSPTLPEQSDSVHTSTDNQEPEEPEKKVEIAGVRKISDEATPKMDDVLAEAAEEIELYEPMDTLVIDKAGKIAGVTAEITPVAEKSASGKAVAAPVKVVSGEMDDETRIESREKGGIDTAQISFTTVDEMPQFSVNGYRDFDDYIHKNLIYPEKAEELGITGKVLIQFIVNQNGQVQDVKAIQMVDSLLDREAIRVVKSSPRWKPGTKNGRTVNVQLVYPVIFE